MDNDQFFTRLPVNIIPLRELLNEDHLFYYIPENWYVIITDIRNSTAAVSNGLHETVNLIATGSIVTVLNLAYKESIMIPFFFGGDGATFLVPPSLKDLAMQSLRLHSSNSQAQFNLELRAGTIPVSEIYAAGHSLKISKFKRSAVFSIPVVLGNGLTYAEKIIKGEDYLAGDYLASEGELDLTGMQCRWDHIAPPKQHFEVITLLAIAIEEAFQPAAFQQIIGHIDEIYGTPETRQPISVNQLKLNTTFAKLELEMRVKFRSFKLLTLLKAKLVSLLGYLYFRTGKGKSYLNRLVDMSDTLVLDGKINTVITGTPEQRARLTETLDAMERDGLILYGIYVSKDSVMSCYVRDLEDGHIHFVDGSEGGYTKAASVLKPKLKNLNREDSSNRTNTGFPLNKY